jgi:hypothetical protein
MLLSLRFCTSNPQPPTMFTELSSVRKRERGILTSLVPMNLIQDKFPQQKPLCHVQGPK